MARTASAAGVGWPGRAGLPPGGHGGRDVLSDAAYAAGRRWPAGERRGGGDRLARGGKPSGARRSNGEVGQHVIAEALYPSGNGVNGRLLNFYRAFFRSRCSTARTRSRRPALRHQHGAALPRVAAASRSGLSETRSAHRAADLAPQALLRRVPAAPPRHQIPPPPDEAATSQAPRPRPRRVTAAPHRDAAAMAAEHLAA